MEDERTQPAEAPAPAPRRGRPRDEGRRAAILGAAGDLMLEGGLAAATVGAIAARAGVSKQTIYNWWPSRGAVAFEGFMVNADPQRELPAGASVAVGLRILAEQLVKLLTTTPAGPLMRSLIADGQSQAEVADLLRDGWLAPRRATVVELVERGIERGELRAGLDVDAVIDLVFGPIYYRLLLGHAPLTEAFADRSVEVVLHGIAA